MRKGSTSFGACEVQCWRWLFANKIPVSCVDVIPRPASPHPNPETGRFGGASALREREGERGGREREREREGGRKREGRGGGGGRVV